MDINNVFNWLNFIVNKNQSGQITPAQFNLDAERSQIEFFNKENRLFQTTREVTDALSPFLVPIVITPDSSGQVPYPEDYSHVASVRHLYFVDNVGIAVAVEEVKNNDIGGMQMSQIAPATMKYPKVSYYDNYLQFYPKNIKAIQFDYFRKPVKPVWAYKIVNNRPVYDPINSVDLEVNDEYMNEIVVMMASYYGLYLSNQQVVQYAEMAKAQGV